MSAITKLKEKLMLKPDIKEYKPVIINLKNINIKEKIIPKQFQEEEEEEEEEREEEEEERDQEQEQEEGEEEGEEREQERKQGDALLYEVKEKKGKDVIMKINDKRNLITKEDRNELLQDFIKVKKDLIDLKKINILTENIKETPKQEPKKKEEIEKHKKNKKIKKRIIIEDEDEEEFEKIIKPQVVEEVGEVGEVGEMKEVEFMKQPGETKKSKKIKNIEILKENIYGPETIIEFGDTPLKNRFSKDKDIFPVVKVSSYFMNNRKFFINFINNLFLKYRDEMEDESKEITCDNISKMSSSNEFSLLTHQKLIRDYLNLYTPYRGLLLYHGLGSGKTCSSIAIAEGMKTNKKIIIMLPASLRQNYIKELKKCGDYLYKRNQYWEWVSIIENPEIVNTLSKVLNLPLDFINKNKGAFLVNVTKPSNYESFDIENKNKLEKQIDTMIQSKYQFINYNGLRNNTLKTLTNDYTINIFDNSVVIIDESHNLVSRIVNKISKEKEIPVDNQGNKTRLPISLSLKLYELLMSAKNTKVVMLSGTPMINYPNEIGIMFNILRGYIKTWSIPLNIQSRNDIEKIKTIFKNEKILDYIFYDSSSKILNITRNPFGFENKFSNNDEYSGVSKYKSVKRDNVILEEERGIISDELFEKRILKILNDNNINVLTQQIVIQNYKCLPDILENFIQLFSLVKDEKKNKTESSFLKLTNIELFKKRIMGLTSYFRSAQEDLLPKYEKISDFHIIKVPMSDYQFNIYEIARQKERQQEKSLKSKNKINELYKEPSSTYKIFSRLYCNFVMPVPPGRPMPNEDKNEIEDIDKTKLKDKLVIENGEQVILEKQELEGDDILEELGDTTYKQRINDVLRFLKENPNDFLSPDALRTYSPKYLYLLENIKRPDNIGLNLIYSQFRTLEGIGIFVLVLEANGFAHFKIKKNDLGIWDLNINEENFGKPMFALYTGTESEIEKDIIRNIYNGDWYNGDVPSNIVEKLEKISRNNNYGEIIKILMITASGSEGINLKNTRYVHIMESYWHSVRLEQVIGRARRICSHNNLEQQYKTVEVFLYLMTFTQEQINNESSIELRLKDASKTDPKVPLTSDELLYQISSIKETFSSQIINAIKESSIDCAVFNKSNSKEGLNCLSFYGTNKNDYSYSPNILNDPKDESLKKNINIQEWTGIELTINGKKYILNQDTDEVFDYESYMRKTPLLLGKIERRDKKIVFKKI